MKNSSWSALGLTLVLFSAYNSSAFAQTSETTPSKIEVNTPPGDEVDQVITNNYLRALSGSKSHWSFNSITTYNGGTLNDIFGEDRPNIAAQSATTLKTDLDTIMSVKYALTSRHSLLAGFGVRWIGPAHEGGLHDYPYARIDAVNPQLMYQYVYGIGSLQAVLQVVALEWTQQDYVHYGYAQNFTADQETMYEIGHSGVTLALSFELIYSTFFNHDPSLADSQSEYQVQIAPYVEYKFNDTYDVRFVTNLWDYEHYREDKSWWTHDTITDSVGLGITLTRDIYIYPNFQFTPEHASLNNSNVAVQANISLF